MNETNQSKKTLQMVLVAVMAAAICVVAPFSVPLPFTAVPISFTNFMIYLALFAIGWKRGTIAYILYMAIGAVGVPVFSGFTGGLQKFAGPTGGYLIGFVFLAIIAGLFIDGINKKEDASETVKIVFYVVGMVLGLTVCYIFGTIWFMIYTKTPFEMASVSSVLGMCVIPFLPGDAVKIIVATIVGVPLRKTLRKNQLV